MDVHVAAINELARLPAAPSSYVIVGFGKTATDGIVWLLVNGVPPDCIVWLRPRDPWRLNRAVVQPDPVMGSGSLPTPWRRPPRPSRSTTFCRWRILRACAVKGLGGYVDWQVVGKSVHS